MYLYYVRWERESSSPVSWFYQVHYHKYTHTRHESCLPACLSVGVGVDVIDHVVRLVRTFGRRSVVRSQCVPACVFVEVGEDGVLHRSLSPFLSSSPRFEYTHSG